MGLVTDVLHWLIGAEDEPQARTAPDGSLEGFVARMGLSTATRAWHPPTIREALSVPAISRAVTLIANTTGSLTVQAFRAGAVLAETPRVIARPDPFSTPRDFYRDVAWNMASRGEAVLWIAKRDAQGYATALVNVPLHELKVEDNPANRLFPIYRWGGMEGRRYSPVTPDGEFVHITYAKEPGALRGVGPLQLCDAAVSVSVEAQAWAANFYGDGGNPSVVIKHAGELSPEEDEDGLNEADRLRAQWVDRPNNVPRVIDQNIESVEYKQPTEAGAQMLDSRQYQNGDAARMFGMPGALVEYNSPGSSLTYQNLADIWVQFVRGCLAPNYLEPIEQAFSDLLPRQTMVRFRVQGLYRADAKTRWDIYKLMLDVLGQERAAEVAMVEEDLAPGNPEVAPVPFAPPAAIPTRLPEVRTAAPESEVRCSALTTKRQGGVSKLTTCNRLLSTTGAFEGQCPRCKTLYHAA